MYGWTDPYHPDGADRRREQPLGEEPPAWLTDRPEPRSAYLFGDDPEQPADEWHRDQPTARWQPEPAAPAGTWQPQTTDATATWRPEPTDRWQAEPDPRWAPGSASPADGAYPAERPFPRTGPPAPGRSTTRPPPSTSPRSGPRRPRRRRPPPRAATAPAAASPARW